MKFRTLVGLTTALMLPLGAAEASIIMDLGNGWEATLFSDNLDLVVDKENDPDVIVLEKFAVFDHVDQFTGRPASLSIGFRQTLPDELTASQIVITEEFISNKTGFDWTGFRMILMGKHVSFKNDAIKDFDINPFTEFELLDNATEVFFFGGVVQDASFWNPGGDGAVVINVDLEADGPDSRLNFVLKELPVIPAPGGAALLAGVICFHRRRRRVNRRAA